MALAFESVYGTAPASGFHRMPFASSTLGSEQPLLNSELLGYGRDPLAPLKDAVTADGDVVIPVDAEAWGVWLAVPISAPLSVELNWRKTVSVPLRKGKQCWVGVRHSSTAAVSA